MKHLSGAMVIGVVLGFSFYWVGLQIVRSYYPDIQASLSQAVALLVGIVGCLLAAVISAKLFPPKRTLTEQETTEEDRARILHELQVDITLEAADMKDMPQDILDEMHELHLDKLFQSSTSEKKMLKMEANFMEALIWGVGMAFLGSIVFSGVGLISGTDETATIAPLTLLVVLLGVPPVGVFSWFIASAVSKHMTHAIPTALMGIPGDTMAVPMLRDASILRQLGVPHIALRKMISGAIIAALLAVPVAVGFASLLAPFGDIVKQWAPVIFAIAALIIAYTSSGRWGNVFALIPFAFFVQALNKMAIAGTGKGLFISFFLGIAIGPLLADLLTVLSPISRHHLATTKPREFWLAPELKMWSGYFPNPLKILTKSQLKYTTISAVISSLTFTFSPVGMTVMVGEAISSRVKGIYQRTTTALAAMNGTTEATYIAEALIPLIAFGVPLSPVALGPAAPLFNAPPIFQSQPTVHNLHNLMSTTDFLVFGFVGVICAAIIAYPFSMNYARRASVWVLRNVSQEAIISMFSGLIVVLSYSEGGIIGVGIAVTIALFGGILNRYFGIHTGVQFMAYYASGWMISKLFGV